MVSTLWRGDEQIEFAAGDRLGRLESGQVLAEVRGLRMVRRVRLHRAFPMVHRDEFELTPGRLGELADAGGCATAATEQIGHLDPLHSFTPIRGCANIHTKPPRAITPHCRPARSPLAPRRLPSRSRSSRSNRRARSTPGSPGPRRVPGSRAGRRRRGASRP